ncbi:unnamed protein product [Choristocarpus tenellus]
MDLFLSLFVNHDGSEEMEGSGRTWNGLASWLLDEKSRFALLASALQVVLAREQRESTPDLQAKTFLECVKKDLSTKHTRQIYNSILVGIAPDVEIGDDGVISTFQSLLSVTARKYDINVDKLRSSANKRTEFMRDMRRQASPSALTADADGGSSPVSDTRTPHYSPHDTAHRQNGRPRVFDMRRDSSSLQFDVQHPDTHVLGITVWESNITAMPHDPVTSHDATQGMHYLDPHMNKRVFRLDALCQQHAQRSSTPASDILTNIAHIQVQCLRENWKKIHTRTFFGDDGQHLAHAHAHFGTKAKVAGLKKWRPHSKVVLI